VKSRVDRNLIHNRKRGRFYNRGTKQVFEPLKEDYGTVDKEVNRKRLG